MTWSEASDHSVEQLEIILDAVRRRESARTLNMMQSVHLGAAGCLCKEGAAALRDAKSDIVKALKP